MPWKFNKDNWQYIADDNIEEFLSGVQEPIEIIKEEIKPKVKRSKKSKQVT